MKCLVNSKYMLIFFVELILLSPEMRNLLVDVNFNNNKE